MPAKHVLSDEVRDILSRSRIEPRQLFLPEQLERKTYDMVAKILKAAGGKWNRQAGCHVFTSDPREVLGLAIDEGAITDKKVLLQQYYTPSPLAISFVRQAHLRPSDLVLEPSAGQGHLATYIASTVHASRIFCFDIDPLNVRMLRAQGFVNSWEADFLSVPSRPVFTTILMNPPFTNGQDIEHILHAMTFLAPGGCLYAMASAGVMFGSTQRHQRMRQALAGWWEWMEDLPDEAFKEAGAGVQAVTIRFQRP